MDRGRLQLALVMLGGLWVQTARAETLAEQLSGARKALVEKEKRDAKRKLKEAESAILGAADVVPPMQVARYWYLCGMEHHLRRKTSRAMDAWRNALVIDPRFEWDIELVEDRDPRRLFEALRGEIRERKEVTAQVPEKVGAATLWVDGQRVRTNDVVRAGNHLLQVLCPDETVHAQWSELPDEDLEWLALCPEGVDTSVVVVEAEEDQDEFDGLAPEFDDMPTAEMSAKEAEAEEAAVRAAEAKEAAAQRAAAREARRVAAKEASAQRAAERKAKRDAASAASAQRAAERKAKRDAAREAKRVAAEQATAKKSPTEDAPAEDAPAEDAPAESTPAEDAPAEDAPVADAPAADAPAKEAQAKTSGAPQFLTNISPRTYAMTAGGALVVGGIITNYAVVKPVWDQIEDARANPDKYSRWQADWLTSRFNSSREATLGLIGGGVVVAGAGYFLLDAPVLPVIRPGGAGITGRW